MFIRYFLCLILLSPYYADAGREPQTCLQLGVNLNSVDYYSSEAPFVDLMKMSSGWIRPWGSKDEKEPIPQDENGNPLSIAPSTSLINVIHDDLWGRPPEENRYILTWQGDGTVVPSAGSTKVISSRSNQVTFDMLKPGRIWLEMKRTSAVNPVKNVQLKAVLANGQPMAGEFRTPILDNWNKMRILRFMDWGKTNNSPLVEWVDRAKPGDVTQSTSKGVAYEYMIDLANKARSNPWVNVPHAASDDYVRHMARKFRDELNPELTVYVEYTNEAWNGQFQQFHYLDELGKKNNLAFYQAYTERALQINDIWKKEFGRTSKMKFILAGQFGNPWITEQILKYKSAGKRVDGFAVGYYIGWDIGTSQNYSWLLKASPKDVINLMKDQSIPDARKLLAANADEVRKYGLPLMAYEAGQHLVAVGTDPTGKALNNNQQISDLLIATNRDPGMADVYRLLLEDWQRAGGREMLLFSSTTIPTKWGSWGLKENEAQAMTSAHKLRSIYQFCGWLDQDDSASKNVTKPKSAPPVDTKKPSDAPPINKIKPWTS